MIKKHEDFPIVSDEIVVWHYFSLSKFLWMIENGQLHFTRADRFEDKYEFFITDSESKYIWGKNITPSQLDEFVSNCRKEAFINCWTKSEHELILMWNSYASAKEGVAIKSTVKRIIDSCIGGKGDRPTYIFEVRYINPNEESAIPEGEYINTYWFAITKRNLFEQEKEVRLVFISPIYKGKEPLEDFSIEVDLVKLIEEIRVSPNAEEWFVDLIKSVCKRYGLEQIPVFKSEMI
ncbi:MAG: DUF2971 domain-containing protein [Bacteroidales bacterium]|nr:DUF2971 domain-containing protein [Bacteroidales bacterium]